MDAQFTDRFAFGMLSHASFMHVAHTFRSFAAAGLRLVRADPQRLGLGALVRRRRGSVVGV
jgi:hypothetical protein